MKTIAFRPFVIELVLLSLALAGCVVSTPTPTPAQPTAVSVPATEVPTAIPPTNTPTTVPTNTPTVTPTEPPTATPTRTLASPPTRTKGPAPTAKPRATAAPKTPPLANVIQQTIDNVVAFKMAFMGGGESCADFVKQYTGVVNGPTYDVTGQPSSVQTAYALYRQAVDVMIKRGAVFNEVCSAGGGKVGHLDWEVTLKAMDQALSYLDQAAALLK